MSETVFNIGMYVFDNQASDLLVGESDVYARHIMHKAIGAALKRTGQHVRTNLTRLISAESYLKKNKIRSNIKKLRVISNHYDGEVAAWVIVNSGRYAANEFRLIPRRGTVRKAKSTTWPAPGVQIGPNVPKWFFDKAAAGYSKPWIGLNKAGKKQMLHRHLSTNAIEPVPIVSLNYFASFHRVSEGAFNGAAEVFEKRLMHEVQFRLGKMK